MSSNTYTPVSTGTYGPAFMRLEEGQEFDYENRCVGFHPEGRHAILLEQSFREVTEADLPAVPQEAAA